MSPVSRRIFLYWVLLLVPTLAVGGGAILLLRREQARLAEQGAYADEARRAAIAARTRLIVENVELLVGDVQAGLLETLGEPDPQMTDELMAEWERANPLVRTAFRVRNGAIIRPSPTAADEEARGFLRRFRGALGENPPWQTSPKAPSLSAAAASEKKLEDDFATRKEVDANVAQVQNARRDVQELFKARQEKSMASADAVDTASPSLAGASAPRAQSPRETRVSESTARNVPGTAERRVSSSRSSRTSGLSDQAASSPSAPTAAVTARAKDVASARGWWPMTIEGRMHLLAWVQLPDRSEVRGVEVETAALLSRLGSALPAEPGVGAGYALRDATAQVIHQTGAVALTQDPVVRVPVAATLLPGWDVVAYLVQERTTSSTGPGIFWVGALLVAIFVTAILAGGSLLLWQARRSEEEAQQKTSFVANVSHEFKTPLTTIRLYSELLEQGRVRDSAQGGEYLRTIGRETQRLARLVNNALDFSRLEQGRKKYAREMLDVTAELQRLLDTHHPRVAEAGLKLERDFRSAPVMAAVDRDALEQIVLNLIDNACKYAGHGGEVLVRARPGRNGSGATIIVADRGPGVPPEHRARIFEKFHRVDEALTAEKSGAGLGLSIARQLARGMGGELTYAPREAGGAEFHLELP